MSSTTDSLKPDWLARIRARLHSDTATTQQSGRSADRVFFGLAAFWFLALTLFGFGPSFFFRPLFPHSEPLATQLMVHGVVFSAWIAIYAAQTTLISARNVRAHRVLGASAFFLILLMIPVGLHTVLLKWATGIDPVDETGFLLSLFVLIYGFALSGVALRKRPDVHKRLMFFATLVLVGAAASRATGIVGLGDDRVLRKLLSVAPGIALVAYDTAFRRRWLPLSLTLLGVVWAVEWFTVSDLIFMRPAGEVIVRTLAGIFVW